MSLPYTDNATRALNEAEKVSKELRHYFIGCEHILIGLIRVSPSVAHDVLVNNDITEDAIRGLMNDFTMRGKGTLLRERDGLTPRSERVLQDAEAIARQYNKTSVATEHILLAILRDQDNVALQMLLALKKNIVELYALTLVTMGEDPKTVKDEFKKKDNKKAGEFLSTYSKDLTLLAKEGRLDPVVGRDEEITRVIQILSRRTKNNPCLVGEPGVGKTAIVEGLALRIVAGNVPETVKNKRVLTLDLPGMVAGTKYRGEFEERMKKLLSEVSKDPNIVLFLDEIHTLIGAGGSEGAIDAANILKPSLSRGEIQLIGATTQSEYRKHIEKDAALERRFQPISVDEPSEEETIRILKGIAPSYEKHHHVSYTEEALDAAVRLSSRYINDRYLPDKAIDLIDEAGALVRLKNLKSSEKTDEIKAEIKKIDLQISRSIKIEAFTQAVELKNAQRELYKKLDRIEKREKKARESEAFEVNENHIADVVSVWTKVPVKKLTEKESERLLKLESILHKRVIGQEDAVEKISKAMRRQRVGLQDPNRPLGSFLFLGPTGVGKTELSKALAEAIFGSESSLIRVDMSEYMESHSVSKMIGSPPGYVGFDEGGQLADKVRKNPYSVVLFDEIEKAHPDVFNVLLQVLDDGHITDSKGRKINFKNTIIIMTSNAGAQRIVEPKNLGFEAKSDETKDYNRMKSSVMEEVKRIFKPEFINRIDDIIVFRSLNKKDMYEICTMLSKKLITRCKEQMDISLTVSKDCKDAIIEKYQDLKMGARPMKRAIQAEIEDKLSEEILKKTIVPGDTVVCKWKNGEVLFQKKES